jgi:hypothetical protein
MTTPQHHGIPGGDAGGAIILVVIAGGATAGATQTSETGPILAFVGALLVVVITAVTANRRQVSQLAAERERHREMLESQSQRLDVQLAHDRKIADIQHLRELLDVMASAYESAETTGRETLTALTIFGEEGDGGVRRQEAYFASRGAIRALATELHRLEMRFSSTDLVFVQFAATLKHLEARQEIMQKAWIDSEQIQSGGERWKDNVGHAADASLAFTRFAAAARKEIGVREAQIDSSE